MTKGNKCLRKYAPSLLLFDAGVTPVTAEANVFSYRLLTSPQFAALGANTGAYAHVVGYEAFSAGETDVFSGVRLIDERLVEARSRVYGGAVRRMKKLRAAARVAGRPDIADDYLRELRQRYARRPSLIQRMDAAGL